MIDKTKKLTIIQITSMHYWNDDRIYERACIGLKNKGLDVRYMATEPDHAEEHGEAQVETFWLSRCKGLRRRILSSFEAYQKLMKMDADIIHFHDPDLLPWMYLLSFSKKGIVYDIHENYLERVRTSRIPGFLKGMVSRFYRWFEVIAIRRFSGYVVTTETMGRLYDKTSKPFCVVSNTPYLERLNVNLTEVTKRPYPAIYISGTHSNARNCRQIVEAIPYIIKDHPDVRIIFAGRYLPQEFEGDLRNTADKLGVSDNLLLEGSLPWAENFLRTASMHIGLVFYQDNLNNRVTIPNRLFEYMISGLAVVGEDFPEVRKVIQSSDCGVVTDSSRPEEIGKAIISLLNDRELLEKMGKNGRRAVLEKYNFEEDLERMIDYYHSILSK